METAVTRDIRVRVITTYQEGFSDPSKAVYFFSYHISVTNLGVDKVVLLKRHWRIAHSNGVINIVDGEGVVGETPVIESGGSHQYTSGCELLSGFGTMKGYYTFRNLNSGEIFEAEIPQFKLEVPFLLS